MFVDIANRKVSGKEPGAVTVTTSEPSVRKRPAHVQSAPTLAPSGASASTSKSAKQGSLDTLWSKRQAKRSRVDEDEDVDDKVTDKPPRAQQPEVPPQEPAEKETEDGDAQKTIAEQVREDVAARELVAAASLKPQRKPKLVKAPRNTVGNVLLALFRSESGYCRLCGTECGQRTDNFPRHFTAANILRSNLHKAVLETAKQAEQGRVSFEVACDRVRAVEAAADIATPSAAAVPTHQVMLSTFARPAAEIAATPAEAGMMKSVERDMSLALFFANNNIALDVVDSVEFQGLMAVFGVTALSSQTLRNRMHEFMTLNRHDFQTSLSMRVVNFTTDYWKELGTPFIGVTVHWVDEKWQMQEQLLALFDTRDWSSNSEISREMVETLIHGRLRSDVTCFVGRPTMPTRRAC